MWTLNLEYRGPEPIPDLGTAYAQRDEVRVQVGDISLIGYLNIIHKFIERHDWGIEVRANLEEMEN